MEVLLRRFNDPSQSPVDLFADLVTQLRPVRYNDGDSVTLAIHALCHLLANHADLRVGFRRNLLALLNQHEQVSLYASVGILPNTGFFSEAARRISHKLLPEVIDLTHLKDILSHFFNRPSDEVWVGLVSDGCWLDLLNILRLDEEPGKATTPPVVLQVSKAIRVLSHRISAIGLEPELVRHEPSIEEFESPFLAQNPEALAYLTRYENWWINPDSQCDDDKQLLVLLDQCNKLIERIHRHAALEGTSIRLTFVLKRLQQHLDRFAILLALLDSLREDRTGRASYAIAIGLFKTLVHAQCRKNDLYEHWRQSVGLLALRVTENASRAGEHYITETRSEYFAMWRSALGAGFIVAFMAMSKLYIGKYELAPLTYALLVGLNYGLGFVLIHVLHCTLATKQPAMTAAAIAASIDEHSGKQPDLENLTSLIASLVRSQLAAILGNVFLAIPVSIALGLAVFWLTGVPFIDTEQAGYLLEGIHPLHSGALIYAAIAGIGLFLSGLIAGYYDNLGTYNNIPRRLIQLKWLRRTLGAERQQKFARYVENNLGALAGNFFFGCMLGAIPALSTLLGLPLDVRHITFSSAYLGFASVAFDFHLAWGVVAWSVAGIVLIGCTNLAVSFSLALITALRARQVSFAQEKMLLASVLKRLIHHPREFFLPPKAIKYTVPEQSAQVD